MRLSLTTVTLRSSRGLRWGRCFRLTLIGLLASLVTACSSLGYYAQSVSGHLRLMAAARPIDVVRADPQTVPELAQTLARAQAIRAFASDQLGLPANASYTTYASLNRGFAVWSVVATPEFSLEMKTWCYPVVGCAGYRGYYDEAEAQHEADQLRAAGWDVNVVGVPAYSTLGWFADPLLNTFISRSEAQLAGLMFHELAHQQFYLPGDTAFNEAFATAVEAEGVRRWLARHGTPAQQAAWTVFTTRRDQFLALLRSARTELELIYAAPLAVADKRGQKAAVLAQLRLDYLALRDQWNGWPGYDRFFAQDLGNAHLAVVGAYHDQVPAFAALLEAHGNDLPRFYAAVAELARLAPADRGARMTAVAGTLPR